MKIKKSTKKIIVAFLALSTAAHLSLTKPSFSQENKKPDNKIELATGINIDINSKYIARGFNYGNNPVIQPSAYLNINKLTGIIWTNYDTKEREFNEVDYIAEYSTNIGKANLILGYAYYDFLSLEDKTQEIYGKLALPFPLSPTIAAYHDSDLGRGNYFSLTGNKNINLGKLPLNISGTIGYNDHQFREKSSFSDALFKISIPLELNKFTITPSLNYSKALDKNLKDEFFGGLSIGYNF